METSGKHSRQYRFLPVKTLVVSLLLTFALSACQSTEPPSPSAAQLQKMAQDIEAAAVNDVVIMNSCSSLGGTIGSYAEAARETWQFSNRQLLADAERLLNDNRHEQVSIDTERYSLMAIDRVHDLSRLAAENLNLAGRSPDGQKSICQRQLSRIETETYSALSDVYTAKALTQQAAELDEFETGVADILTRWPQWPQPGRSYISLAETGKAQCGAQSRIITLDNNWPNERYALYCGTDPVDLYQCEWGTCEASMSEPPEH